MKKILCVCVVVVCAVSIFISTPAYAETNTDNHAAVVIDTGEGVPKTACITFRGDSITGAEALELAQAQPVFQSFSGVGRAVCSLCGVGCPAGDSCLTCAGSTFWNYFRSTAGTASFTLSGVGAGASVVRNGDVEGWKFGVGQKPPYLSYNSICGIQISQGTSVSQKQTSHTTVQLPNKSTPRVTQPTQPTEVPSSVLGTTVTRQPRALKGEGKSTTKQSSHSPEIFAALAIIVGLSAAGYFLYQSRSKKITN